MMKFILPKLIKVSDDPNLKMIWTFDMFDEIKKIVPEAYIIKHKNGAGWDLEDDLPIPVIGSGRGLRFLVPFFERPTFVRSGSGCMRSCLKAHFNYSLEDYYCHMVFGDRNLRPIDPDTGEMPRFAGLIKGFFESSSKSSQTFKVNYRYIWNDENRNKNHIISAANMKLGKYKTCSFYFAKLKSTDGIKLGFTSHDNVSLRLREHRADDYRDIIKVADGPGDDIIILERDTKLKFMLVDETFDISQLSEVLDYIYSKSGINYNDRKLIEEFICR